MSGYRDHLLRLTLASAASLALPSHAEGPLPPACGGAPLPDEALRRVNAVRSAGTPCRPAGLGDAAPVRWSVPLAEAARTQSHEMALQGHMAHHDRQARGLGERLQASGYRYSAAVENVAVGYASLDRVVEAWVASETHCANLMNAAVVELGIACVDPVAPAAAEGRYWTLLLGAPRRR